MVQAFSGCTITGCTTFVKRFQWLRGWCNGADPLENPVPCTTGLGPGCAGRIYWRLNLLILQPKDFHLLGYTRNLTTYEGVKPCGVEAVHPQPKRVTSYYTRVGLAIKVNEALQAVAAPFPAPIPIPHRQRPPAAFPLALKTAGIP